MTTPPPSKRAKLDSLHNQIGSLVQDLEEQLEQKDKALSQLMNLAVNGISFGVLPHKWMDMPEPLRSDPTALKLFLLHHHKEIRSWQVYSRRSDYPEEVLHQILPQLLANHRPVAIEALEINLRWNGKDLLRGFFTWEQVKPSLQECQQSLILSLHALRLGLVSSLTELHPSVNEALVVALLKGGFLEWDQIPDSLKNCMSFCRLLLDPNVILDRTALGEVSCYSSLIDFSNESTALISEVFSHHPILEQDHQVWENFLVYCEDVNHAKIGFFKIASLWADHQPADPHLKERFCRKYPLLLRYIDQVTFSNLMRTMITEDPKNVFHVKYQEFVQTDPDFVVEHLARVRLTEEDAEECDYDCLVEAIPPDLWTSREDLTRVWFDAGLPLLWNHPVGWNSDPDRLLSICRKAATRDWIMLSFRHASNELMGDVNFITRAMQLDPANFQYASDTLLEGNFELAMWALGDRYFVENRARHIRVYTQEKLQELYNRATQELAVHDAFVNPFLCAMSNDQELVGMLHEEAIVRAILDYVGAPRGNHLRNIRKALTLRSQLEEERRRRRKELEEAFRRCRRRLEEDDGDSD